jgi:signal transduction histidine kinase
MSLDDLKGKSARDVHTKEIAEEIARLDSLVLLQGRPQIVELDVKMADGREWPEIHVRFPIEDDNGNFIGLGVATFDISAQRAAEKQLRQAQRLQVVGQLSGGVSHDFNNLLQVIEANLALAKMSVPEGSHATELIDAALQAGRRGADLTGKLLAFSRQQILSPSRLDINTWLMEETRRLARTFGKNIAIRTEPCGDPVDVVVDEDSLTNAILNLALNACAAMPGGGTITLAARRRHLLAADDEVLPAGDYVEIAVTDTGTGMSKEVMSRAFEPFFTTKGVGQGSGLGLSMVHGFARQSDGNAEIESTVGKGTTVRLLLPAAPPDEATAAMDDGARHGRSRGRPQGDPEPGVSVGIL